MSLIFQTNIIILSQAKTSLSLDNVMRPMQHDNIYPRTKFIEKLIPTPQENRTNQTKRLKINHIPSLFPQSSKLAFAFTLH